MNYGLEVCKNLFKKLYGTEKKHIQEAHLRRTLKNGMQEKQANISG
jgi:hypothetical protein